MKDIEVKRNNAAYEMIPVKETTKALVDQAKREAEAKQKRDLTFDAFIRELLKRKV